MVDGRELLKMNRIIGDEGQAEAREVDGEIKCPECGSEVKRRNLEKHILRAHREPCPQCKARIQKGNASLERHFKEIHGRQPTSCEITQFVTFRKTKTPYSDRDFVKPWNEVSGGSVSPK
jgi:endogenous inhibitor of DNA gyrase (YacG/DUF329 family)